jgi:NAD(P)-dependent dehydrogenase (short-subunit alcohol dehydrogenase family)
MAKAAINMLTHTSASELATHGIFMNAVDTGWVTDEDPAHLSRRKKGPVRFSAVTGHRRRRRPGLWSVFWRHQHRKALERQVLEGLFPDWLVTGGPDDGAPSFMIYMGEDFFLNKRLEPVDPLGEFEVYPNRDSTPYKEI